MIKKGLDTIFPKPEKASQKSDLDDYLNDEDFQYILNSAEVPAEIYIFGFGKDSKKAKNEKKQ